MYDTDTGNQRISVRPQDAAVYQYQHVLACPTGGSAALLAGAVIGRARAQSGPLDLLRRDFEANNSDLTLSFETVTDGEYWESFLDDAEMVSATLTRQGSLSPYLARGTSGAVTLADLETTIKPAGRGIHWPAAVFRPLLARQVSPGDVFGVGFNPDTTAIKLQSQGQQRTVYLDGGEPPSFTYPVGDPDRRDAPSGAEFTELAEATIARLLPRFI